MPWWATAYVIVFVLASVEGLADDRRRRASLPYLLWGGFAGLSSVALVVLFFHDQIEPALSAFIGLLLAVSLTFEIASMMKDLRRHEEERLLLLSGVTIFSALLYAPAFACGIHVLGTSLGLWP